MDEMSLFPIDSTSLFGLEIAAYCDYRRLSEHRLLAPCVYYCLCIARRSRRLSGTRLLIEVLWYLDKYTKGDVFF